MCGLVHLSSHPLGSLQLHLWEHALGMTEFQSDEEFGAALRDLIARWCDQRRLAALARLLPGYVAFNGLTDGWGLLLDALKSARALGREAYEATDWDALNDLILAAEKALTRL